MLLDTSGCVVQMADWLGCVPVSVRVRSWLRTALRTLVLDSSKSRSSNSADHHPCILDCHHCGRTYERRLSLVLQGVNLCNVRPKCCSTPSVPHTWRSTSDHPHSLYIEAMHTSMAAICAPLCRPLCMHIYHQHSDTHTTSREFSPVNCKSKMT